MDTDKRLARHAAHEDENSGLIDDSLIPGYSESLLPEEVLNPVFLESEPADNADELEAAGLTMEGRD